jgi:hypothetical protein
LKGNIEGFEETWTIWNRDERNCMNNKYLNLEDEEFELGMSTGNKIEGERSGMLMKVRWSPFCLDAQCLVG